MLIDAAKVGRAINDLAKDETKVWTDALQLLQAAFAEAETELPSPDDEEQWAIYQDLIPKSVAALAKYRGRKGTWRTTVPISESIETYCVVHEGQTTKIQAKSQIEALIKASFQLGIDAIIDDVYLL